MAEHPYDQFLNDIQPFLLSKVEEFHLLGYGKIKQAELWEYLKRKKWRKPKEEIYFHEIVEEVLSVKVSDYMNYASIEAMKLGDFSFDNEEELRELLK